MPYVSAGPLSTLITPSHASFLHALFISRLMSTQTMSIYQVSPPPFILHPTLTATLSLSAQCALPFEVLLKTFIPFVFFCALHGLICLMLVAYKGLKRKGRYARMKR